MLLGLCDAGVMNLSDDQQRVKALLTETITLLCKNGLRFQSEVCIDGVIGITVDNTNVFLVSIRDNIQSKCTLSVKNLSDSSTRESEDVMLCGPDMPSSDAVSSVAINRRHTIQHSPETVTQCVGFEPYQFQNQCATSLCNSVDDKNENVDLSAPTLMIANSYSMNTAEENDDSSRDETQTDNRLNLLTSSVPHKSTETSSLEDVSSMQKGDLNVKREVTGLLECNPQSDTCASDSDVSDMHSSVGMESEIVLASFPDQQMPFRRLSSVVHTADFHNQVRLLIVICNLLCNCENICVCM